MGVFEWPVTTLSMQAAVIQQLATTLSIRDRSGVFREFEDAFAQYHARRYSLLSNSGTSAIMSMFEGIQIGPGDQVIAPAYGFHASVSPAVYMGADVVFADIDEQGGLSAEWAMSLVGENTKAIVVSHLWGLPTTETFAIAEQCARKGIYLFEDCSHAHGATLHGSLVGSIGTAAAWSLQGQKIVSGGEGGILLTDDESIFERAVLQGHYNRRTRDEISRSSPLWNYHETGLGLKLRAHPLAIAIALEQFGHLDAFLHQKRLFAQLVVEGLREYEFLRLPDIDGMIPSWYALPLRFDARAAGRLTREDFVAALRAEGLSEVDVPAATGVIADLPLFSAPEKVLGRRRVTGRPASTPSNLPVARAYAAEIIKIPVWAFAQDEAVVQAYVVGIRKVADHVARWGSL
ncbi:dTDP-4-amino-4,6-dideoxygalactose transaminase [Catellatospora citrea]|nr:dTDP-4-amino-4,6-dideoxygalactose transaminase [Catellatospora citrea]